jgi:hypothetical protein
MELSPSRGTANCAATQELPSILWKSRIHYRVHKSHLLAPILSQISPINTIPSYLSKIHFNNVHPPTSSSSQCSLSFWLYHQYPIYSYIPRPRDSDLRLTLLARANTNCKRQVYPLVREGSPHPQTTNCLTGLRWASHQDRPANWLSIVTWLWFLLRVDTLSDSLVARQPPAGKNTSTEAENIVGIRHQATTGKDIANCCDYIDVWSVQLSETYAVICG